MIKPLLTLFLCLSGTLFSPAADRILAEWTFDRPGDLEGWLPNAHLSDVAVTNGVLSCRAVGADPILEYRPLLDLKTTPWQAVDVRRKADHDGVAELFWSNTSAGRYGGFAQEKTTRFNVRGDNQWQAYRLLPFWHLEGRIVRLRFDVFDGARFELDSLRIIELEMPPAVARADFDFGKGAEGWQWVSGSGEQDSLSVRGKPDDSLKVVALKAAGFLLSPPVRMDTQSNSFVSIRMAVDRGANATLFFATDQKSGLQSHSFAVESDGHDHTYNLDMLAAQEWKGTVLALGLRPTDPTNATAHLSWLKVADAPQGPPQLKILSFGVEDPLPRVGRPATLRAVVSNSGAEVASNLQGQIILPPGLTLASAPPASEAGPLGFDQETSLTWEVRAERPIEGVIQVQMIASNAEPATASTSIRMTLRPRLHREQPAVLPLPKGEGRGEGERITPHPPASFADPQSSSYVPVPHPVRGPYEVGAYYFPGWQTSSQWQPIRRFPERKPVLGWYREGAPEVADWHIKWAVEHGITFFAYDWYWSQGARQL